MTTTADQLPRRSDSMAFGFPALASAGFSVATRTGKWILHSNFDHGASAAALKAAAKFEDELVTGSAGIHRGDGPNSLELTKCYEQAREVVRRFLGAPPDHAVVFTTNTTGAINTVAHSLAQKVSQKLRELGRASRKARVIVFGFEHHANILPWRKWCDVTVLPIPASHGELLRMLEAELAREPADLVAVTGASNVTGEMLDLVAVATTVHRHSSVLGRTLLLGDLAQLAPHHPVNMLLLDLDIAVLSGHKMGAPYGVGVLACVRWLLEGVIPLIVGGGIVEFVYADVEVDWQKKAEALHEPGSPNVIGALTLAVAMATLKRTGLRRIADAEAVLLALAYQILTKIDGLEIYSMWDRMHPKIGVISFNLKPFPWGLLCAILSGDFGYSSRGGCHCAHILVAHLLGIPPGEAKEIGRARRTEAKLGTVRFSFGLDTTERKLTDLDWALRYIAQCGLTYWTERYEPCGDGHWRPKVDKRTDRLGFAARTSW